MTPLHMESVFAKGLKYAELNGDVHLFWSESKLPTLAKFSVKKIVC